MMIDSIRELVSIPSVTGAAPEEDMPFGKPVNDALKYVLNLCDSFGFKTKNCDNKVGWAEIGEGDTLIGILCHLDVVPVGKGWKYDPFDVTEVGERIYGRGVIDDKGPAIAAIYAMRDVMQSGVALNKRVRIIFGCQEEEGDWPDMEFYKNTEEVPDYGFTPDAFFPAIYGEKGILMLTASMPYNEAGLLSVKGGAAANMVADSAEAEVADSDGNPVKFSALGKSAHGSKPEQGDNAISKLMKEIGDSELECRMADFYNEKIGFCINGKQSGCYFSDEESGELTFNVGKIEYDDKNVTLQLDLRFPVTYKKEQIIEALTKGTEGWGIKYSILSYKAPVYADKEGEVIEKLMEAYAQITRDSTEPQVMGGGTYARAIKNIVAFGPVFPGTECTEHQANEYISYGDLKKARQIYKLAIAKLACE